MSRPKAGRGLFYTRDSEGRGDCAPPQEVRWAAERAREIGVKFTGAPDEIERMMRDRRPSSGDLFLDYGVPGNVMKRPGLDALRQTALEDKTVSHVFIPRPDRLVRPNNPVDGLLLEHSFRSMGLTIVFRDRVATPLQLNRHLDPYDLIVGVMQYDQSGRFRLELADKLLRAQVRLAELGFSIGGSPPYGFERWLAGPDRTPVRKLLPGERVRMAGHHVVWLPTATDQLAIIERIFDQFETRPASQIASLLTAERVPAPESNRRTTSGVWHATTVRNIVQNCMYVAMREYGKRSEGDQMRFTPTGPRLLTESDHDADGRLKTVVNPPEQRIRKALGFDACVGESKFAKAQSIAEQRAGTQKGKKRQRGDAPNPLGCRVFDLACGWPMYRLSRRRTYFYTCGLYQQSNGELCEHNTLPGPAATRFVLECVRQRALSTGMFSRLARRVRELAEQELGVDRREAETEKGRKELETVSNDLKIVTKNLSRAQTDAEYEAIRSEFNEVERRKAQLELELRQASEVRGLENGLDLEVEKALSGLGRIGDLLDTADNVEAVSDLIKALNAKLYVQFDPVQKGRRTVNVLIGGVLTLGSSPPPVTLYEGPTDKGIVRKRLADGEKDSLLAGTAATCGCGNPTGPEGQDSSGNVQRRTRRCT
jgi:Recombinase